MEKQSLNRRLVLVPCPFQGHLNPMLQLGAVLRSRGFRITVAHTIFNSPSPVDFPDFDFLAIPDGLADPTVHSDNFISVITGFNSSCKAPLRDSLAQIMAGGDPGEKISCVIYDEYMYFSNEVADHLKLPSVVLATTSAANTLSFHAIPRLVKAGYFPLQDSMWTDLVPGLQLLRFKDLPVSGFAELDELLELIAKAKDRRSALAAVWNTSDCLESSSLAVLRREYQIPVFAIGPAHKMVDPSRVGLPLEESGCISWLDEQIDGSVIYISLGSIAFMGERDLTEMAWGLANSEQPFLWVIRTDPDELPEDLKQIVGESGRVVKWAPQKEVLAHRAVGGFWSHCGWNSTIESVSEGVPMICQPCFGDQRVNSRYLSRVWRVGLETESDLNRIVVERAVRRLMAGEEGQEMRQRAMELKQSIDVSVKEGGSSCNSLDELLNLICSY